MNGLFECTPELLDTLSNRIDYLEKICQKVESASKKHTQHLPPSPSSNNNKSKQIQNSQITENQASKPEVISDLAKSQQKEGETKDASNTEMRKQPEADTSAEKKFLLNDSQATKSLQSNMDLTSPHSFDSIKSIFDVRKKLKMATLDLMNRVKQVEEGVMKVL